MRPPTLACALSGVALACGFTLLGLAASPAGAHTAPPAASAPPSRLIRIGRAPGLPAGTQPLAAAASGQKLRITVALKPRDAAALKADAEAVEDPGSPDYREYLSTQQFAARFAPTQRTITLVETSLRRAGLRPVGVAADRLSLDVVADAGSYERALHLELAHVMLPSHRTVLVNLEAPALPAAVARYVQAIIGLDGRQTMRTSLEHPSAREASLNSRSATPTSLVERSHQTPAACPAASATAGAQGAYTAGDIASAYSFGGLYAAGDEGAGVSIGVYELEPDALSDIAAYQSCYGTHTPVSYTQVDGGVGTGAGSGEAAFDLEQIIGLAPQANVIVYQGPNSNADSPGSGPYDIFAAMISQDRVSIITNSWGECEAEEGATDAHAENTLFEEAALQGQSVLSAAGDDGSEDCDGATGSGADGLAVDDPGSQPFVTDVGGTSMTAIGPPPTQSAWNSGGGTSNGFGLASGTGAGGGGVSALWGMPAYQSAAPASLDVINADSSAGVCAASAGDCREVPDVSADADPAHGYVIYYNGEDSEPGEASGWQATGGTSGASPVWAAVFAEANASGACAGTPIGFANPALYRAAELSAGTYFTDVTSGDNDFTATNGGLYPATPGYDMATGLGTPDVSTLAPELCQEALRLTVPASLQSFVGRSRTLTVGTADGASTVTTAVRGLPAGVSYDAITGVIAGTPAVPGADTVTVVATDPSGAVRIASFVWDVAARPTLSRLRLTGAGSGLAVLSLRLTAGRAEAALGTVTVELPAGLTLVNGAGVTVTAPATHTTLARRVSGSGRRVTLTLEPAGTPLVVRFGAGSLRVSARLSAAAQRRRKPTYHVTGVVRDADGAISTVRGSATVAT